MLRINTYGPDLLEGDTMPEYRELVEEVITPKFAADFEKNAPLAEATVEQAGLARTRRGVQHRRLGDRLRLGHRAGGRLVHAILPEEPGLRRAGRDRAARRSGSRSSWSRSRAVAGRRLQPAHRHRRTSGTSGHRHRPASQPDRGGHAVTPDLVRPARRRARRLGGRDPRRVEDRDRRPRPRRPPVPGAEPGRRGAPRHGQARRVRRDAGARASPSRPPRRRRRPPRTTPRS